jgi:hypothetical protein
MGPLVMGLCVMGHSVMGRFVMGRFVCESYILYCSDGAFEDASTSYKLYLF